ncbi:MAG: transporter substrate-binding domain-containing protein [Mesorhizobium sp.]|nr:MAG: transporter substrate-binding domain-containing protein [Mesorhizobium sp.]RWM89359.1 MAG: transporter substrate-binding domain-containing protein [Mesorhizobium sp.]
MCSGTAFLVKNAKATQVTSFEDIARLGYKVGVCGGCVEEKYAVSAGVTWANIVVIPDVVSGLNMLSDQRIDVIASTDADLADAKQKSPQGADITLVSVSSIPRNCTAAAFNKNDVALRDAYNEGLKKIRASGEYKKILSSYNQEVMGAGTDTTTTAQLCSRK